jgi:hypothetical protein
MTEMICCPQRESALTHLGSYDLQVFWCFPLKSERPELLIRIEKIGSPPSR